MTTTHIPIQVTFHNMKPSEALEATIRRKAEKLTSFYERIISCQVFVDLPHLHQQQGKCFHVKIDLEVPGEHIIVNREIGQSTAHEDPYVAVRDAFDAARRQLQEFAQRVRGDVKTHTPPPLAEAE
ncbi:MAG TPA: HPF/RaiA family ribosome-associated protein [Chloroflexia bacterium]|nr:HPF/RaiA family ribosome-associated protein [Chloroflexia bacterium]